MKFPEWLFPAKEMLEKYTQFYMGVCIIGYFGSLTLAVLCGMYILYSLEFAFWTAASTLTFFYYKELLNRLTPIIERDL